MSKLAKLENWPQPDADAMRGKEGHIPRIEVGDHVALGKQITKWCRADPSERPQTIKEAKEELAAAGAGVTFPAERFSDDSPVFFIDTPLDAWVVRLPPRELMAESIDRIKTGGGYPADHLPKYYQAYLMAGQEYDEDFLYARIGDYTVAQCA